MLQVRISDDPADMVKVLNAFAEHADELPCGPGLAQNLQRVVQDGSYRFLLAEEDDGDSLSVAGMITFFLQPMADTHMLAVEALWLSTDDLTRQLPLWQLLIQFAQRLEFGGVCITSMSTNAAATLQELVKRGSLDGCPVTVDRLPLQKEGNSSAVHSAFSDNPIEGSAFISLPAVVIHTRKAQVDLSGREFE